MNTVDIYLWAAMFIGFMIGTFAGWLHERRSYRNREKREALRLANMDFGKHLRGATESIKHDRIVYRDGDSIFYKKPRSSDSLD